MYEDIVYLILQELEDDGKTLRACLLFNRTWCNIIIPLLWKNPWKNLKEGKEKSLLRVLLSHLPDSSKDNLNQRFGISIDYRNPLFNYINYCKHLNLSVLENVINSTNNLLGVATHLLLNTVKNEVFKLLINGRIKFTHLYITRLFEHPVHLIPGIEHCLSEVEFFSCDTRANEDVLVGLAKVCKSIKKLIITINLRNDGMIKFIKAQEVLSDVHLFRGLGYSYRYSKTLEDSLAKHANTMQYFKTSKQPITGILSSLVNLEGLELDDIYQMKSWDCLENLSFPSLQILRARRVPTNALTSVIKNTSGDLVEINSNSLHHDEASSKRIIQVIYNKCLKLKYLQLLIINNSISDLEQLLINCRYLKGLYVLTNNKEVFNWDRLFNVLTKYSPDGLFRFKFYFQEKPKLESLKSFFNNWKDRFPLSLQFIQNDDMEEYFKLAETYKAKGVIEKYENNLSYGEFQWN